MKAHLISTTAKMTLKTHLSLFISAALIAPSAFGAEPLSAPQSTGLPVTLSLDKPGYVTAVIERADGRRVFNLASEVKAQAGPLKFNWDFYDVGVQKGEQPPFSPIRSGPRAASRPSRQKQIPSSRTWSRARI